MSRSIRVLCLTHGFPRSATDPVGLFVLQLAIALRAEGILTDVVCPGGPNLSPHGEIEGIPVHRYRYAMRAHETLAYTGTMGEQVRNSWTARAAFLGMFANGLRTALVQARRTAADLIHAHWWVPSGLIGAAATPIAGIPLLTTLHGTDGRMLDSKVAQTLFRVVASNSSALTAVSSWLADRASAVGGRPVTVAPMPVQAGDFRPGAALRPPHLLFVGKLTEQKGLHHLLHALSRSRTSPTLEVVGAGRVDDRDLRELAATLGLVHRITWTPILPQHELALRYQRARALIIPAIGEGLGLTAVEAAFCETPVIGFASGGLLDTVRHGETGMLVRSGDRSALAAAIDELVERPDHAAALGAAARRFALGRFDARSVTATYASLYRAIISR